MTQELKQEIIDMVNYYNHHKVENMAKTHTEFVIDDFTKLLSKLEKELVNN